MLAGLGGWLRPADRQPDARDPGGGPTGREPGRMRGRGGEGGSGAPSRHGERGGGGGSPPDAAPGVTSVGVCVLLREGVSVTSLFGVCVCV